jgi:exopolysaccharide production protein ExoQ
MFCMLTAGAAGGLYAHRRRWQEGLVLLLSLVTLVFTGTRSGLVGLLLAVTIVAWQFGTARILKAAYLLILASSGAAAAAAVGLPLAAVAQSLFTSRGAGGILTYRTEAWAVAVNLWTERPFLGYGFRVGEAVFADHAAAPAGILVVHNSYLQTLLELGILGSIPLSAILAVTMRSWLRRLSSPLACGLAIACIAGWAACFVESAMFGMGYAFAWIFWLLVAASTALSPAPRPTVPLTPSTTAGALFPRARATLAQSVPPSYPLVQPP